MAKTKVVTSRQDGDRTVHDFRCPHLSGCGVDGEPFTSAGWTEQEDARERARQHLAEHATGEAMTELHDFRVERGRTPSPADPTSWEV